MKKAMEPDRKRLLQLLEAHEPTAAMSVRIHGDNLILGRDTPSGEEPGTTERDDRLRLTRIRGDSWGLSVKRHTGRWERTPFSGSIQEMVSAILSFMQHVTVHPFRTSCETARSLQ